MAEELELPAAGDTSPAPWRNSTTESPGAVTMAEAVELWRISERTLRRRLAAGEVAGAHKVPSSKGEEWRIPAASLDALGYERTAAPTPEPSTPAPGTDLTELLRELREDRKAWQELATESRRELMAAEADRKAAESARLAALTDAARVEERLAAVERERDAERKRADRLAAELAASRRRRWWQG